MLSNIQINSHTFPGGLKGLAHQVELNPLPYVEAKFSFEGRGELRTYDTSSAQLFGQEIIRTKDRGVEPGFIARKRWTKQDDKKLFDKGHKFHREATKFIGDVNEVKKDARLYQRVTEHLMGVFNKFKKEHWWKLHYAEPLFGRVMIDRAQAKHAIHRLSTAERPREKNISALMEVLSNDIFNILDFGGQKLTLRLSKYENGDPMFLLDGTEVVGPNGEQFQTLNKYQSILKGPKWQGRIQGNMLKDPATGQMVPIDEKKLGSALMKALLLGDRDKVGRLGENLGYVVVDGKAILMNIDPGKSLEKPCWWRVDRMVGYVLRNRKYEKRKIKSDIRTDAIFDPSITPKDLLTGGYKNFTVFNDTQLADRIQGFKDVREKWPQIAALFTQYMTFFKEHEAVLDPHRSFWEKPIHQELREEFDRLEARAVMFLDILGERAKLSPDELNFLDNLEKLTSPTTKKAPVKGKEQEMELKYLRIIDPQKNRIEWSVDKSKGNPLFTFEAKNQKEYDRIASTLIDFLGQTDCPKAQLHSTNHKDKIRGEVQFDGQVPFSTFSQANIIAFKEGKKILKDTSLARKIINLVHSIFSCVLSYLFLPIIKS